MRDRIEQLLGDNKFSIGLELPFDNDWTKSGEYLRQADYRPFGHPRLEQHHDLAVLADQLGFKALWLRDVPVYDPSFNDLAQVFEIFTYLGYLSAVTKNILLGTAAIVLPIRDPFLTLKSIATVDYLSNQRLLLGLATGDRPIEYPIFEKDFPSRGDQFREALEILRRPAFALPQEVDIYPKMKELPPLFVAGLAQQDPAWIGENIHGWLAYPGTPEDHAKRVQFWKGLNPSQNRIYTTFIHLNLVSDPHHPIERFRFGMSVGRDALISELQQLKSIGVDHVSFQLRRNERPLQETLHELAEYVLPVFH